MTSTNLLKGHLAAGSAYAIFGINIVFCKDITACGLISPIALFTFRAIGAALLFWTISLFGQKEEVDWNGQIVLAENTRNCAGYHRCSHRQPQPGRSRQKLKLFPY